MKNRKLSNDELMAPGSRLSSKSRELVPTTLGRDRGRRGNRYDSKVTLPDIEFVFDRLLNTIRAIHNEREKNPKPFEALWSTTCEGLKKAGNATAFYHVAQSHLKDKSKKRESLLKQIAVAWATTTTHKRKDGTKFHLSSAPGKTESLRKELSELAQEAKLSVGEVLGIAIAFWIEARNAHISGDGDRTLYSLMECSYFIGLMSGPKTHSEAASANGSKGRGTKQKDALAELALRVIKEFDGNDSLMDGENLAGRISDRICNDPHHADTLDEYDRWARNGRTAEDIVDRLTETLLNWGTKDNSEYPHFRIAFQKLVSRTT